MTGPARAEIGVETTAAINASKPDKHLSFIILSPYEAYNLWRIPLQTREAKPCDIIALEKITLSLFHKLGNHHSVVRSCLSAPLIRYKPLLIHADTFQHRFQGKWPLDSTFSAHIALEGQ
jgi:hypothetical protein